jgi:hypothetical protein
LHASAGAEVMSVVESTKAVSLNRRSITKRCQQGIYRGASDTCAHNDGKSPGTIHDLRPR